MFAKQNNKFLENIKNGINIFTEMKKSVLVSFVKEIDFIDPLVFLTNGLNFKKERFFWSEPTRKNYLVGLGHAFIIDEESQNNRFFAVQARWDELLKDAIIDSGKVENPYTGPILLGGFCFDPLCKTSDLWEDFKEKKLVLPQYMLTISDDKAYLTINIVVDKNFSLKDINFLETEKELLNDKKLSPTKNTIKAEIDIEPEKWKDSVLKITKDIKEGIVDKVVLARELRIEMNEEIKVENVLSNLLEDQPDSYIFLMESRDSSFLGATPERLIKLKSNEVFSMCLAGTIKRGKTLEDDERLGNELLNDEKNLHEHALVVNMIKHAMEEECIKIDFPSKPSLYKLKNVQHLYTPVKGKKMENVTIFNMLNKLHPTPALGGFPRTKALEMIRKEEVLDRGWYAAPIGWLNKRGEGEFAVAIRSSLIKRNLACLFAGGGIVGESEPESEYEETKIKFKSMLSAIGG